MQFASEHRQKRDQRLAGSHAQMSTIGNSCQVKAMLTSAMSVLRRVIVLRRAGDIQSPAANGLSDKTHQPESAPGQAQKILEQLAALEHAQIPANMATTWEIQYNSY